ncbi:MAG TPA: hypothetical protein VM938_13605 [Acidimicrobiales bacterium]|nr:hypothetical protein [Acidimicrobiales bacterium]
MKRFGLMIACVASFLVAVVPAQPASAATPCNTVAKTPYKWDWKLKTVGAATVVECNNIMTFIQINSTAEVWSATHGMWLEGSEGKSEAHQVTWAYADAWWNCQGYGEPWTRTRGDSIALYGFGASQRETAAPSATRQFEDCGYLLREIKP